MTQIKSNIFIAPNEQGSLLLLRIRDIEKEKLKIVFRREGNELCSEFYFREQKLCEWESDKSLPHQFPMNLPFALYEEIAKINKYMIEHRKIKYMEAVLSPGGL